MLKCFDYKCNECGREQLDVIAPAEDKTFPCVVDGCQGTMERAWLLGHASSVIGDEIDVEVKHALCHPDGSPRRFRSRTEMKRVAQQSGFSNVVTHIPGRSGDKNKNTQNFNVGLPPGVDGRPMSMLSPEEQTQRRAEWLAS